MRPQDWGTMSAGEPHAESRDWVSRLEAAELVGCKPSTIAYYARIGRLSGRARSGGRPTLDLGSVEEFATWWRSAADLEEGHAKKPALGVHVPTVEVIPTNHVTSADAARRLGVTIKHVRRLVTNHDLKAVRVKNRLWISGESLTAYRNAQTASRDWVSFVEAARIAGCTDQQVRRAIQSGDIVQRKVGHEQPSLNKASVLRFGEFLEASETAT